MDFHYCEETLRAFIPERVGEKMQRYFILNQENWMDNQVIITGNDVHHITRVMRNRLGDEIICNAESGKAALCKIQEISDERVLASIEDWLDREVELPIKVTIAQGLPKGDKFDMILQKGTELGAHAFIPFKAARSVVKWDDKKLTKKFQRFEKILKEASEQSHRQSIPTIQTPVNLDELLKVSRDYDFKIIAYEEEAKTDQYQSLADILKRLSKGMRLIVCIGPEGGFTEKEVEILKENDFYAVRFGPRILRTETAALYALASVSYHFEELM